MAFNVFRYYYKYHFEIAVRSLKLLETLPSYNPSMIQVWYKYDPSMFLNETQQWLLFSFYVLYIRLFSLYYFFYHKLNPLLFKTQINLLLALCCLIFLYFCVQTCAQRREKISDLRLCPPSSLIAKTPLKMIHQLLTPGSFCVKSWILFYNCVLICSNIEKSIIVMPVGGSWNLPVSVWGLDLFLR